MKLTSLICTTSLLIIGVLHAEEPNIVTDGDHGYIKIGANWGLCGAISIMPKPGIDPTSIRLESFRYDGDGNQVEARGACVLPASGLKQEYQWAGWGNTHFRVYVYRMIPLPAPHVNSFYRQRVNPNDYITISSRHNVPCVLPAFGGPDAPKEPLNLTGDTIKRSLPPSGYLR